MKAFLRIVAATAGALLAGSVLSASDWTWTYAVQARASIQLSPARVTLQWPTDQIPPTGYNVWRKSPGDAWWGLPVRLPATATTYVDDNVAVGQIYEYQIEKQTTLYSAWGYVSVGLNAPLVESRGKVLLVVDRSIGGAVDAELQRLQRDLVGDGWGVIRLDVGRNDPPGQVREAIRAQWQADPDNVQAVLLFGHVPIAKSGHLNVDGHGARPMPADVYYGELDGAWPDADGDGSLDPYGLPSDMELQVGRVDFADLPGAYASFPFPSETELLRRYLDKDHAFRHALVRPADRALVGNVAGDGGGQAYAASAYRAFAALVGSENVVESGTDLLAPVSERWITKLTSGDFLWSYASGAGNYFSLGILGTHGEFNDVWGSDLLELHAKAAFHLFFGSWISEWSQTDNFMRTALAAPDYGLAAAWSGRPHFYFHHMGSGATIGESVRVSQNNNGLLYRNQIQRAIRGVHMALMGDPTLRLQAVAPPQNLQASEQNGETVLTWTASPDPVLGYRVYRSAARGAPFERISGELHTETRYVDRPANAAEATYMVRAVTLSQNPSGSYYNASAGVFSRADFSIPDRAPSPLPARAPAGKLSGAAVEVGTDIHHPNGNIYDQVLLTGPAASMSADPGQVLRVSFIDASDDIVQVEFTGAGRLSIVLDDASGPEPPAKYNQDVAYMKGRPTITLAGASASTHLTIFSVGRANAVNQALFRDVSYDGVADVALLSLYTADGKFGGARLANTRFSARNGLTGLLASDVLFTGPIYVNDVDAADAATPVLSIGSVQGIDHTSEILVAGGDLLQSNNRPVQISGLTRLQFAAGATSQGDTLSAQANRATITRDGVDVTSEVVANPP
jgi:hypothetical protein